MKEFYIENYFLEGKIIFPARKAGIQAKSNQAVTHLGSRIEDESPVKSQSHPFY